MLIFFIAALNCLTFDFIGTSIDDSGEDFCTVQIPTSWRQAFLNLSTVQLFFDMYAKLPSSLASRVRLGLLTVYYFSILIGR
jgi:exportin-7